MAEAGAGPLLKLLTFLSPAFPVGGFSYSHGLEWVIDAGEMADAPTLAAWIGALVAQGSGWNDAVLLAEAHRAAHGGDRQALTDCAALGAALAGSAERHLETTAQGRAFLAAVRPWPCEPAQTLEQSPDVPYPVAVGAVAAGHGIALADALPAYLNAFAANLVSVAVRLVPLGQSAGLDVMAALHPAIATAAARAQTSTLDDLGSSSFLSEVAAMRHETQYSRVFRT